MNENILNKNIVIYKIIHTNKPKNYLILLSLKLGWILFPLFQSYNKQIQNIVPGYLRLYKNHFKIKGFGFKWKYFYHFKKQKSTIYLKLGFTHRLSFVISKNNKCKIKKKRLILLTRSYSYLRIFFSILFFSFQTFLYNKKGIYLRGTHWKLKLSKKKSKF